MTLGAAGFGAAALGFAAALRFAFLGAFLTVFLAAFFDFLAADFRFALFLAATFFFFFFAGAAFFAFLDFFVFDFAFFAMIVLLIVSAQSFRPRCFRLRCGKGPTAPAHRRC
jgi:hypothetical protein